MDLAPLIRQYEQMKHARSTLDQHCQEIAERIFPRMAEFGFDSNPPGVKRTNEVFDATPALALDRFGAAMESLLTPRSSKWHTCRANNEDLMRIHNVRLYFDELTDLLFKMRYSSTSNFASQNYEQYLSLGAFGTGSVFVAPHPDREGIRYRNIPLSGLYIAEDENGLIDTVFRRWRATARQLAMKWGRSGISKDAQAALEKDPEKIIDAVHVVKPNKDRDPTSPFAKDKPFISVWFEPAQRHELEVGGYDEQAYLVSRYNTSPAEIFGRSPAMTILPDIKMLNAMSKTTIRAAEKVVDPPIIIADDGVTLPVNQKAGGHTFARIEGRGSQSPVIPMQTGGRIDIGNDLMEQRRTTINDAFLITLFQILVDTPNMSATEATFRAQEKGALLAPTAGRQQSEYLGPLIHREINILARQGLLPEMPPELAEAEGEYEITYVSPLARAQRAEEGVGILRTLESIQPLAAADPGVFDNFDTDEITRTLADINGMPNRTLADPAVIEQTRQERAQQAQAQQAIEGMQGVAGAAKDGASALQSFDGAMAMPEEMGGDVG